MTHTGTDEYIYELATTKTNKVMVEILDPQDLNNLIEGLPELQMIF